MQLDAQLRPLRASDAALHLVWDSDTGIVAGEDAPRVRQLVSQYARKPYGVPSRYPPESFVVADPLRRPAEMALLLGAWFSLPPELEALYPAFDGVDLPEGTVA